VVSESNIKEHHSDYIALAKGCQPQNQADCQHRVGSIWEVACAMANIPKAGLPSLGILA
jgi:hypothetical protein